MSGIGITIYNIISQKSERKLNGTGVFPLKSAIHQAQENTGLLLRQSLGQNGTYLKVIKISLKFRLILEDTILLTGIQYSML